MSQPSPKPDNQDQQPPVEPRLRDFPYIVVRVECNLCGRKGEYKLADLAERYGAKFTLDDFLAAIRKPCGYPLPWTIRKRRKMQPVCHIALPDWDRQPRPPDLPPEMGLRLVIDNKAAE